jgi:DNA-directed RNA polymerase subunit A'
MRSGARTSGQRGGGGGRAAGGQGRSMASRSSSSSRTIKPSAYVQPQFTSKIEAEEHILQEHDQLFKTPLDAFKSGVKCEISKISASLLTINDIKIQRLVEITSPEDPDPNVPDSDIGTLYDGKMGKNSYVRECKTCKEGQNCSGHLGYIDLGSDIGQQNGIYVDPFLNPGCGAIAKSILNITCRSCGAPYFTYEHIVRLKLINAPVDRRVKEIEASIEKLLKRGCIKCSRAGVCAPEKVQLGKKPQPLSQPRQTTCEPQSVVKYEKETNRIKIDDKQMTTGEIKTIFSRISKETTMLMGFKKNHPLDMLMPFVIVLPPNMRESITRGFDEKSSDYLASENKAIIQLKNQIREARLGGLNVQTVINLTNDLHDRIFHIFSSKRGKGVSKRPGAKEFSGLKEEISKKEGHIRHYMQGKHIDRSLRAVITPNPLLRLGYCGLPGTNMTGMYVPIYITKWNIGKLEEILKRGELVH